MTKPLASLSLDLDNKWSYLKTHGDDAWSDYPSYFDTVVPRFLEILEDRKIKMTVFVVGQDAAQSWNQASLMSIATAGHEIANHSFHHEPWLHLYDRQQLIEEFETSEKAIREATGQQTIGFRGPGFSISDDVLKLLAERGYQYDATIFPTFLGPVARAYYFLRSNFSREQKEKRKALFGKFSDGFRPLKPFVWETSPNHLIEIPVTTMPIFKLPIHLSYIVYLAKFSRLAARLYFWKTMKLCRWLGVQPSILLHPLDFMGAEDDSDLGFFPGMDLSLDAKLNIVQGVLDQLQKNFQLVPMRVHCEHAMQTSLKSRDLSLVRPAVSG